MKIGEACAIVNKAVCGIVNYWEMVLQNCTRVITAVVLKL